MGVKKDLRSHQGGFGGLRPLPLIPVQAGEGSHFDLFPCKDLKREREKKMKYTTVRIKGLPVTDPAGGSPADGPVGTAWLLPRKPFRTVLAFAACLGGGHISRASVCTSLTFSSVLALLNVVSRE